MGQFASRWRVCPSPTINRVDGGDNDSTRKPGYGSLPNSRGPVCKVHPNDWVAAPPGDSFVLNVARETGSG